MKKRPSWQACSEADGLRTFHLLWSLKANCCVHKNLPLDPGQLVESSTYIYAQFILQFTLILPFQPILGHSSGLFLLYEFLISTIHTQDPPSPPSIILLPQQYLVKSTDYDTPHYGVFSVLLLLSLRSTCSPQHLTFHHIGCNLLLETPDVPYPHTRARKISFNL